MSVFARSFLPTAVVATSALALVAASPAGAAVTDDVPGTAGAQPVSGAVEPTRPAFYEPPASIPSTPGTVIRTEDARKFLDILGIDAAKHTSTRVMYASQDRLGRPIAVTGIVIVPKAEWTGQGRRPLVSFGAGTQGMADRCAPTRQLAEGFEYEEMFFNGMLDKGYAIAMTDYQGLGTPGSHTYMNRESQAHAMLDVLRAAHRMDLGLDESNPIALAGYSQGGGASAAAGELAPSYAPELDIKAISAGAPPADLALTAKQIDGSMWSAFLSYATISLAEAYDLDLDATLNDKGREQMKAIEGSCALEMFPWSFQKSSTLTRDGRPVTAYLAEEPFKSAVDDNRIGRRKPQAPVFIFHSVADSAIPYEAGKNLAKDWCGQGVNVRFRPTLVPGHAGGMVAYAPANLQFLADRFAGKPQANNCWTVR